MPLLRLWRDFAVGELAHFPADRRQRVVQAAVADGGVVMFAHKLDQTSAVLALRGGERLQRAG